MTAGARWRSLRSNQRLPTYVVIAAVTVAVLVLAIRHHVLNAQTLIFLVVFVPAVICHEVSHGVVALWCGDDTAKRAGRLTLNPLKHIDPVGSIVVPIVLALTWGYPFGWAKPVPVAVNRLRHPRNQSVLVSFAGPATNIILAAFAGVVFHELVLHAWTPVPSCAAFMCTYDPSNFALVEQIAFYFGVINIVLAVFNLIPIPPLDGSALVERMLPVSALAGYYRIRMGFLLVIVFLVIVDRNLLTNLFGDLENWYFRLSF
ncbi:MAG: site-2 protease family protein [Acidimicrobiales bacterium]